MIRIPLVSLHNAIDVQIIDSISVEEDETFTLTLSIISTASIVAIDNDVTTIIIEDIDLSCTLSGVADPGRGSLGTSRPGLHESDIILSVPVDDGVGGTACE